MKTSSTSTSRLRPAPQDKWCARIFTRYVIHRRKQLGLTVEEAAKSSGLEVSEWCALESGWLPTELAITRSIAATLWVRWTDLDLLVLLTGSSDHAA